MKSDEGKWLVHSETDPRWNSSGQDLERDCSNCKHKGGKACKHKVEKVSSCEDFEQVGLTMREWVLECKENRVQLPRTPNYSKVYYI